ncbi:MAG TPA: 16S rRNA (cytidine(1402)-2'-O)-methyltransferase [Spongiibacteraceae bacterium]|jgi:16S rRNA (cytidine1402-2'-O)-methyltransferase|nr:16S rRNA (cytidine(1402)-2'-O)-methyltransferase [Spongiibacteraceae bacterium]HUH38664.1 16S rRNA (cytidine(1402)-2'-O)-methyltransferase [Spongiibacteraceae bacterium]
MDAGLYVVATPIGNLGDMVPRAIAVLQAVDLIACEDTRHSRRLLDHFGIETPALAYHDHSDPRVAQQLLARLQAGQSVALISDAGTPLVSDPGFRLVDMALDAGVRVVPIPGACAAIAALSVAGLPTDRFHFEGFLSARRGARRERLQTLAASEVTTIFYEAPHRLRDCLADMAELFGDDRQIVLARELTKQFETVRRAPAAELLAWVEADSNQQRGECVLVVRGQTRVASLDAGVQRLMEALLEELPLKQAAGIAARATGLPRRELYEWGVAFKNG